VKEILVQHCLDHGPNDEASVLSLRETVKLPSAEIIHEALREDRVQDVNDSRGETLYKNRNTASLTETEKTQVNQVVSKFFELFKNKHL